MQEDGIVAIRHRRFKVAIQSARDSSSRRIARSDALRISTKLVDSTQVTN